jgi:hypothetical protein
MEVAWPRAAACMAHVMQGLRDCEHRLLTVSNGLLRNGRHYARLDVRLEGRNGEEAIRHEWRGAEQPRSA